MPIRSRHNPKIRWVARLLKQRSARQREGLTVIEGIRLAEAALQAGVHPRLVLVAEDLSPRGRAVVDAWAAQGVEVWTVARSVFNALSATQTPQGLLAVIPRQGPPWPEQPSFVLVLDAIQDPGNMGTLLRTAWAAGVEGVWVAPGSVDPWAPKVLRAGMGAQFHVPVQEADWAHIDAATHGMARFLAAVRAGRPYDELPGRERIALALSNEARGASKAARAWATEAVHIPMPGGAESLNVAVAGGILMFEVVRQRRMVKDHG
ncbi:MAG: RNA methyltransferase [Chloroflexi bacterium]|nr:RNA methyltransferase [Chloroflexota bacterium]